jgi:hypothetical protein
VTTELALACSVRRTAQRTTSTVNFRLCLKFSELLSIPRVEMGGASSAERSERSDRPLPKRKKGAPRTLLQEHVWGSPFCFRTLYDADTQELRLPHSPPMPPPSFAPNATGVSAALAPRRNHLNSLFSSLETNTQWQHQQLRGLFSVYRKCCLMTEDRGQICASTIIRSVCS